MANALLDYPPKYMCSHLESPQLRYHAFRHEFTESMPIYNLFLSE